MKYAAWIFILLLLNGTAIVQADDHGEKEGGEASRFGPKKGVMDVRDELGFKLNPAAVKNFKIQTQKLSGPKPWRIMRSSIAFSKEETHVFVVKEGYFKSADVIILRREADSIVITSTDLKDGATIATAGVPFLAIVNEAVFGEELAHEH